MADALRTLGYEVTPGSGLRATPELRLRIDSMAGDKSLAYLLGLEVDIMSRFVERVTGNALVAAATRTRLVNSVTADAHVSTTVRTAFIQGAGDAAERDLFEQNDSSKNQDNGVGNE